MVYNEYKGEKIMFKEFKNLTMLRQSCRDFNDKDLEKSVVDAIIDNARFAPSACNSQPWKIYSVTDNQKVQEVAEALQDKGRNPFVAKAKAFVCISEKNAELKPGVSIKYNRNHFVKYDIGELVAYITLTATSLNVGSCIIGWINDEKLKTAINLPDEEICNIVIALGYTDTPLREKSRREKDQVVVEL